MQTGASASLSGVGFVRKLPWNYKVTKLWEAKVRNTSSNIVSVQDWAVFFQIWEDQFPPTCHCGIALFWLDSTVATKMVNMSNKTIFPSSSFHPLQYRIWTTPFPRGGRRFSDWTGTTLAPKQEADNRSDPPYTEQQTEAVKCIYTPITFTSQRAHGAGARGEERRQTASPSRSTRNYW